MILLRVAAAPPPCVVWLTWHGGADIVHGVADIMHMQPIWRALQPPRQLSILYYSNCIKFFKVFQVFEGQKTFFQKSAQKMVWYSNIFITF